MKPKSIPPIALIILLVGSTFTTLRAASYSEAEFTRLEKEVKVLKENSPPHAASLGEQLKAVTSVATGMSSRAEMRFPDKTLTRLGSNSRFTLRGDARTLDLEEGVMMLSVPKKMGGAKIRTSAVTAALTGTTVEFEFSTIVDKKTHKKKEILKMIVVEGSVDLFRTNKPRDFITVPAGKMIIMDPNGPWQALVDVDIKRLRKTSPLLNEDDGPLPTSDHINDSVQAQQAKLGSGELIETSLMIPGRGTQVSITTATALNAIETNALLNAADIPAAVGGAAGNNQSPTTGLAQIPGFSVLNNTSTIKTDPFVTSWNSVKNGDLTSQGALYRGAADGAFSSFAFGRSAIPNSEGDSAAAGFANTAVFRFENLIVNGSPVFDLTAPTPAQVVTNVILAADNDIVIGPDNTFASSPHAGSTSPVSVETRLDVPATLDILGFWTNQGSIHLKSGFEIHVGDNLSATNPGLGMIAASPQSDVTIEGGIHLFQFNTGFSIEAGRDVNVLGSQAIITQAGPNDAADLHAGRNLLVDGASITANKIYLAADTGNTTINNANLTSTSNNPSENGIGINGGAGGITMTNSTVSSQIPADLYSFGGDVTVTNSTVSSQAMTSVGGVGAITLTGSTITGNDIDIQATANANKDITITNTGITATGTNTSLDLSLSIQAGRDVIISMTNSSQIKNLSTDVDAIFHIDANAGKISITGNGGGSGAGDTLFSGNDMNLIAGTDVTLTNIAAHSKNLYVQAGGTGSITLTNANLVVTDPAVIPVIEHGINLQAKKDNTINITDTSQIKLLSTDANAVLRMFAETGDVSITGNGGGSAAADTLYSGNKMVIDSNAGNVTLTNMAATANDVEILAVGANSNVTLTNADITANAPAAPPAQPHGISATATKNVTINISDSSQLKVLASDPNAVLKLLSNQGNVSVTGNGGAADTLYSGNDIYIDASAGNVTLTNMVATAQNAFRARANGPSGILTVSGSTINAGNLIRLYAEGASGGILFIGKVNLNTTGAVDISGNTVKVQTGGVVNIPTGSANIYSNNHDYELNLPGNATHGRINGPIITPHAGTGGRPTF